VGFLEHIFGLLTSFSLSAFLVSSLDEIDDQITAQVFGSGDIVFDPLVAEEIVHVMVRYEESDQSVFPVASPVFLCSPKVFRFSPT